LQGTVVCRFVIEQEVEGKLQRPGVLAADRPGQFDEFHAVHPSRPRALYLNSENGTAGSRGRVGAGIFGLAQPRQ
jgi:hypothetical protein